MQDEADSRSTEPFSYEILDQEAAKISGLVLAVNEKCAGARGKEVACELFYWAEQMSSDGRLPEAEFLYLHAINIWERHFQLMYPVTFVSLRGYALMLLNASDASSVLDVQDKVKHLTDQLPRTESNAA